MGADKPEDLELTPEEAERVKGGMLGEPGGGSSGGGFTSKKKRKKKKSSSQVGAYKGKH